MEKEEKIIALEEKIAFIEGAFLAVGNVSNPSTSGYHLEFIFTKERLAKQFKILYSKVGDPYATRAMKDEVPPPHY